MLTLRNREFVEAARSLGAATRRIWFRELLPNLWAPLIVYVSLTLPLNIGAEAALCYLGVGLQPPTPEPRQHPQRLGGLLLRPTPRTS